MQFFFLIHITISQSQINSESQKKTANWKKKMPLAIGLYIKFPAIKKRPS